MQLTSLKELLKHPFKYLKSYLVAKFGPRTDFATYVDRLNVCKECSWKIDKGNYSFCKSCMCPETKLHPDAILWNKCRMAKANCPRSRWKT